MCTAESKISIRFALTCHFETSVPNDPKIILNTKRSKVPHIHVTGTPESQISLHFSLLPAICELQAILRHVYWMTPNDLEH